MNLELVTRKELATFFKVTRETIHNWEKTGVVKRFCTINGKPRYQMDSVVRSVADAKKEVSCS